MKQNLLFVSLISASLAFTSCKDDNAEPQPQPDACFTVTPSPATAGATVTFTSCATDAHHFEWDFGDSATSDQENPTHIYNNPGTYTIEQHVFSEDMTKSDSTTNILIIN